MQFFYCRHLFNFSNIRIFSRKFAVLIIPISLCYRSVIYLYDAYLIAIAILTFRFLLYFTIYIYLFSYMCLAYLIRFDNVQQFNKLYEKVKYIQINLILLKKERNLNLRKKMISHFLYLYSDFFSSIHKNRFEIQLVLQLEGNYNYKHLAFC